MSEAQPRPGQLVPVTPGLLIPAKIAATLPDAVRTELAMMPAAKQGEFLEAFRVQSRSLLMAYLTSLIYCHYGLLGRWAMTGMMLASLVVAVTLGWVWWLIDLVRMPGMVRAYNQRVAAELVRELTTPSDAAPLAGA